MLPTYQINIVMPGTLSFFMLTAQEVVIDCYHVSVTLLLSSQFCEEDAQTHAYYHINIKNSGNEVSLGEFYGRGISCRG